MCLTGAVLGPASWNKYRSQRNEHQAKVGLSARESYLCLCTYPVCLHVWERHAVCFCAWCTALHFDPIHTVACPWEWHTSDTLQHAWVLWHLFVAGMLQCLFLVHLNGPILPPVGAQDTGLAGKWLLHPMCQLGIRPREEKLYLHLRLLAGPLWDPDVLLA